MDRHRARREFDHGLSPIHDDSVQPFSFELDAGFMISA
jgi:hypothetical protein